MSHLTEAYAANSEVPHVPSGSPTQTATRVAPYFELGLLFLLVYQTLFGHRLTRRSRNGLRSEGQRQQLWVAGFPFGVAGTGRTSSVA